MQLMIAHLITPAHASSSMPALQMTGQCKRASCPGVLYRYPNLGIWAIYCAMAGFRTSHLSVVFPGKPAMSPSLIHASIKSSGTPIRPNAAPSYMFARVDAHGLQQNEAQHAAVSCLRSASLPRPTHAPESDADPYRPRAS